MNGKIVYIQNYYFCKCTTTSTSLFLIVKAKLKKSLITHTLFSQSKFTGRVVNPKTATQNDNYKILIWHCNCLWIFKYWGLLGVSINFTVQIQTKYCGELLWILNRHRVSSSMYTQFYIVIFIIYIWQIKFEKKGKTSGFCSWGIDSRLIFKDWKSSVEKKTHKVQIHSFEIVS